MTNYGRFLPPPDRRIVSVFLAPGRETARDSGPRRPRLALRSGVVYLASTRGFGPRRGGSTPPPGTDSGRGAQGGHALAAFARQVHRDHLDRAGDRHRENRADDPQQRRPDDHRRDGGEWAELDGLAHHSRLDDVVLDLLVDDVD